MNRNWSPSLRLWEVWLQSCVFPSPSSSDVRTVLRFTVDLVSRLGHSQVLPHSSLSVLSAGVREAPVAWPVPTGLSVWNAPSPASAASAPGRLGQPLGRSRGPQVSWALDGAGQTACSHSDCRHRPRGLRASLLRAGLAWSLSPGQLLLGAGGPAVASRPPRNLFKRFLSRGSGRKQSKFSGWGGSQISLPSWLRPVCLCLPPAGLSSSRPSHSWVPRTASQRQLFSVKSHPRPSGVDQHGVR